MSPASLPWAPPENERRGSNTSRRPESDPAVRQGWRSVRRAAAGDVEYRAGRKRAFVRAQPGDERRYLVRLPHSAHRNLRDHVLEVRLRHLLQHRSRDHGRSYAVDEDAGARNLFGQGLGEADHPRLRSRIGGRVWVAFLARYRGDVDDAAPSARDQPRERGAAHVIGARQVDGDDALEFAVWELPAGRVVASHARAVDEDVDGLGFVDGSPAGLLIRYVQGPRAGGGVDVEARDADS